MHALTILYIGGTDVVVAMLRQKYNTQKQKKMAQRYSAIRIWPDTRISLRQIGHKAQTYDQIIQNLIHSYMGKEEMHRVFHKQDWTPVTYGKLDATREDISSLPSSSTETDDDNRGELR
jgi:hypothetical protein